jgi:hypothetical protein
MTLGDIGAAIQILFWVACAHAIWGALTALAIMPICRDKHEIDLEDTWW